MGNREIKQVFLPKFSFPPLYKRVGVYCRVSSNSREQLDSLSNQASEFVRRIYSHNDMKLVDIYLDIASGEKEYRSEFSRMIADTRTGKLDVLYVKSISRFGRNTEDAISALRTLKEHNVQVIFDEEGIDTLKDDSEFVITVLLAYSQAENDSRRQAQLWSLTKRLENGTSELYSRTCYGYYKNKEKVICISHTEATVVQLVFSEYLKGASIIGIQKLLKENEIKTSRGKDLWSKRAIEQILTNEKYTGNVIVRKTITSPDKGHKRIQNLTEPRYMVNDVFPAIISKEIFDAVQEERIRRSNIFTDEEGTHRKDTHYSSKK